MLLRVGLALAERIAASLPAPAAYALADLAGRTWHRMAPERRRLVAANLARVCEALGRPSRGRAFDALVRRAFIAHARYYLELLRAPHYAAHRLDEMVVARDWDHLEPIFRGGVVAASPHLGNFEPYGYLLAAHGLRAVAPMEEIQPRELYEFMLRRRGAGTGVIELIPLARSRSRLVAAARAGQIVALIADRDLTGNGVPVTFFGHPTTLPAGPAFLALATSRPLLVARCLRVGRDRFEGCAWEIPAPANAATDRDEAIAAMTTDMARRFEQAIAEAPEQWWGAFQPIWPDVR